MKTWLSTFTALLTLTLMSFSAAGPSIKFDKMEHDFGRIPQGEPVTCVFTFENDGNAPLVLKNVKASCGCTTPQWPQQPIMPGESATIKAEYNAAADGKFDKTISVYTNIDDEARVLKLRGTVFKTSIVEEEEGPVLQLGK